MSNFQFFFVNTLVQRAACIFDLPSTRKPIEHNFFGRQNGNTPKMRQDFHDSPNCERNVILNVQMPILKANMLYAI